MSKAKMVLELEIDVEMYPANELAEAVVHQVEGLPGILRAETK